MKSAILFTAAVMALCVTIYTITPGSHERGIRGSPTPGVLEEYDDVRSLRMGIFTVSLALSCTLFISGIIASSAARSQQNGSS